MNLNLSAYRAELLTSVEGMQRAIERSPILTKLFLDGF